MDRRDFLECTTRFNVHLSMSECVCAGEYGYVILCMCLKCIRLNLRLSAGFAGV